MTIRMSLYSLLIICTFAHGMQSDNIDIYSYVTQEMRSELSPRRIEIAQNKTSPVPEKFISITKKNFRSISDTEQFYSYTYNKNNDLYVCSIDQAAKQSIVRIIRPIPLKYHKK